MGGVDLSRAAPPAGSEAHQRGVVEESPIRSAPSTSISPREPAVLEIVAILAARCPVRHPPRQNPPSRNSLSGVDGLAPRPSTMPPPVSWWSRARSELSLEKIFAQVVLNPVGGVDDGEHEAATGKFKNRLRSALRVGVSFDARHSRWKASRGKRWCGYHDTEVVGIVVVVVVGGGARAVNEAAVCTSVNDVGVDRRRRRGLNRLRRGEKKKAVFGRELRSEGKQQAALYCGARRTTTSARASRSRLATRPGCDVREPPERVVVRWRGFSPSFPLSGPRFTRLTRPPNRSESERSVRAQSSTRALVSLIVSRHKIGSDVVRGVDRTNRA